MASAPHSDRVASMRRTTSVVRTVTTRKAPSSVIARRALSLGLGSAMRGLDGGRSSSVVRRFCGSDGERHLATPSPSDSGLCSRLQSAHPMLDPEALWKKLVLEAGEDEISEAASV